MVYEVGVAIIAVNTVPVFSDPKWALSLKWKDAVSRKLMLSERNIDSFLGLILLWEIEVVSTLCSLFSRLAFRGLIALQGTRRSGRSESHFILHLHLVLNPVSELVQLGRLVLTFLLRFLLSGTLSFCGLLFSLFSLLCRHLLLFLDVVSLLLQGLLENHHIFHLPVLLVIFFLLSLNLFLSSLSSLFLQDFAFVWRRLSLSIFLRHTFLPFMLHFFVIDYVGDFWITEVKEIFVDHVGG